MRNIEVFTREVKAKLDEADKKFFTTLSTNTAIRFDLRGNAAGQAGKKGNALTLRFNVEAIELDWNDMFNDTIPHEVAHLVTYQKPGLGKNHNRGWQRVAIALGSTGNRTHELKLTPGRTSVKYKYVLPSGKELMLGAIRHKRIQNGHPYSTKGEPILAAHLVQDGTEVTPSAASKAQVPGAPSMSGLNTQSKAGKARIFIQNWIKEGITEDTMLADDYYVNYIQNICDFPSRGPAKSCLKVNIKRLLNAG